MCEICGIDTQGTVMASNQATLSRRVEAEGRRDLFAHTREVRSSTLAIFDERVVERTGMTFSAWVTARVEAGKSLREMAAEFRILHGTLWRWIKRRMPDLHLREEPDLPTPEEFGRIVKVWREDEVTSSRDIADQVGVSIDKVKAARRQYHKRSKALMRNMLSRRLSASAETRRRSWQR